MGLDKAGRLAILDAERGPLEHEAYAAAIELEVKEEGVKHGATGVTQAHVEACKERYEGIQAQIKVIDDAKEKVELEEDPA
jgi:hypothetical protein